MRSLRLFTSTSKVTVFCSGTVAAEERKGEWGERQKEGENRKKETGRERKKGETEERSVAE